MTLAIGVLTTGGLLAVAPAVGKPQRGGRGRGEEVAQGNNLGARPPTSTFWTVFCPATTDTSATSPPWTSVASCVATSS